MQERQLYLNIFIFILQHHFTFTNFVYTTYRVLIDGAEWLRKAHFKSRFPVKLLPYLERGMSSWQLLFRISSLLSMVRYSYQTIWTKTACLSSASYLAVEFGKFSGKWSPTGTRHFELTSHIMHLDS